MKITRTIPAWMLGIIISPVSFASEFQASIEAFNGLAIGVAYLLGVISFGYGLYGIYQISGAQQSKETVMSCILSIITGASLLSVASMYDIWFYTLYGEDSVSTVSTLISINPNLITNSSQTVLSKHIPPETLSKIVGFLKFFGLCCFIKGIYLIKKVGQVDGNEKISVPKVLSHILGGMALVNLPKFSCTVAGIVGLPYLCITGG